jgi:hypothetical protein
MTKKECAAFRAMAFAALSRAAPLSTRGGGRRPEKFCAAL